MACHQTNIFYGVSKCSVGMYKTAAFPSDGDGWYYCDGRSLNQSQINAITAAGKWSSWNTAFGSNLPNPDGRVFGYVNGSHALGSKVGAETVSLTADQNGQHSHTGHVYGRSNVVANGSNISVVDPGQRGGMDSTQAIGIDNSGSGSPHNNMQPTFYGGYLHVYIGV